MFTFYQMVTLLLISSMLIIMTNGLPFFDFSREDDRDNEISGETERKIVIPRLDRLFSSAEVPVKRSRKYDDLRLNRNEKREAASTTTDSSKHAHSMITSMLSFVNSVVNFGRSFVRNE
ncbi:uncharacterized protein [Drosophila tropicalis]|uniref:uncharacterized protein n=1 Tax=Drosophila tropicalis TaxID=46794 RepID=UPI0035ABA2E5